MSVVKTARAQTLSPLGFWLSLFVALIAVFAPSNLFYGFDQFDWAVRGLRIDYLLPKLYLTDIFLLGIFFCSLVFGTFKKTTLHFLEKILIFLGSALFIRQFFTEFPIAAITQFLRLFLLIYTANFVTRNWSTLKQNWIWLALIVSNLLQGCLSLWQFTHQRSLGSYHWLFGEPNLSQSFGIAQASFGSWGERILPYGTTAHPNILAAWLVSSWLLLMVWSEKIKVSLPLKLGLLISTGLMAGWGVFATQSLTALGLLLHGIGYVLFRQLWLKNQQPTLQAIKTGLLFLVCCIMASPWLVQRSLSELPTNVTTLPSISRRVFLQAASQTLFFNNLVWGVGLNQFTAHLDTAAPLREPVRFDQPVHHVVWLWLTETGLLGLTLLMLGTWYGSKTQPALLGTVTTLLWLLYPSLVWDHYLLTQPTGLWIIWLWWVTVMSQRLRKSGYKG